jgi:hypothetical protein
MSKSEQHLVRFIINLLDPPAGIDYALQKGSGNGYECVQKQRSLGKPLIFNFPVTVKINEKEFSFGGPHVHGPSKEKFIYLNIGGSAGQHDTIYNRRLKIPLYTIEANTISQALQNSNSFETSVAGTAKDGTPSCATIKPFAGWKLVKENFSTRINENA